MPEPAGECSGLGTVIDCYKADPESVYNTWFIGGEGRTKAFRSRSSSRRSRNRSVCSRVPPTLSTGSQSCEYPTSSRAKRTSGCSVPSSTHASVPSGKTRSSTGSVAWRPETSMASALPSPASGI